MASFTEKLNEAGQGKAPTAKSLTFLSDLSVEERDAFRQVWPQFPLERRRNIVDMLVTMAEDNIDFYFHPVLIIAIEDSDPQVRLYAIEGLYEDNGRVLLGKLIEILARDPHAQVRAAAAMALGRFTYLAECDKLGTDAPRLRDALLRSARNADEEEGVRRRAIEALGYLDGDMEVQSLIEDTYRQGERWAESALFAMGRNMNARWHKIVLDELESSRPAMRYEAARAAGEIPLEDALPLLVRMVDDTDLEVKLAVVWALGQIGGRPAAEALAHAAKSEEPAVRDAAKEALEEIVFSANPLNVI